MQLVATGLSLPRGIEFDAAGNLLVVESGNGDLTALTFQDNGGCLEVSDKATVITGQGVSTCNAAMLQCGIVSGEELTCVAAQSWTRSFERQ